MLVSKTRLHVKNGHKSAMLSMPAQMLNCVKKLPENVMNGALKYSSACSGVR